MACSTSPLHVLMRSRWLVFSVLSGVTRRSSMNAGASRTTAVVLPGLRRQPGRCIECACGARGWLLRCLDDPESDYTVDFVQRAPLLARMYVHVLLHLYHGERQVSPAGLNPTPRKPSPQALSILRSPQVPGRDWFGQGTRSAYPNPVPVFQTMGH